MKKIGDVVIKVDYNRLQRDLAAHIEKNMMYTCVRLVEIVKEKLNVSGRGKPSKPPAAPHKQDGNLINSISYRVYRDGNDVVGVYGVRAGPVGTDTPSEYARRLELGFVGAMSDGRVVKMQLPRPFLAPAYTENKARVFKWLSS